MSAKVEPETSMQKPTSVKPPNLGEYGRRKSIYVESRTNFDEYKTVEALYSFFKVRIATALINN